MDLGKSLDQLERSRSLPNDTTDLIRRCLEYRKIPIGSLSLEQLRLLIGQKIGLPYLIPLALEMLSDNPLAEGDLCEGDLLMSILRVPVAFWSKNIYSKRVLQEILVALTAQLQSEDGRRKHRGLLQAIAEFEAR